MNDLISRNDVIEPLKKSLRYCKRMKMYGIKIEMLETIIKLVEETYAVDAVEVVRCRDCKNWKHLDHIGCTDFAKLCKWGGYMVGANGYCVYGERRAVNATD